MQSKNIGTVTFRPHGELADRVETMKKLKINQSGILNEILTKNLKAIDEHIAKATREIRKQLDATAQ